MRYKLRHIWIAAAALALGSCSQEATDGETGGRVPVELTATGLQPEVSPMTRATVDGNWKDFTGGIAVKIGDKAKEYTVTATAADNYKTATLTCAEAEPFYWPESGGATVEAWWPYNLNNMAEKLELSLPIDQSEYKNYANYDYIEATGTNMSASSNKLEFTHRTAKIRVVLTDEGGNNLTGATVALDMDGMNVVTACYAPSDAPGEYVALVAPRSGTELKVTINGKYIYTYSNAYTFDANNQYTFKLTVKGDEVMMLGDCTIGPWAEETVVQDDGTAKKPFTVVDGVYHVATADGLTAWAEAVKNSTDKNIGCVLEDNITMPDGETWTPVGSDISDAYKGTFDGNNHTIKGLSVESNSNNFVGFFGYIGSNGEVKNLTLDGAQIDAKNIVYVGGVAGANEGKISHCYVTNSTVSGHGFVGGIAGNNGADAVIQFCGVTDDCTVSATSSNVGGIAGITLYNSEITGCYACCTLSGTSEIGGIASSCSNGNLTACYSNCTFPSGDKIGGIIGTYNLGTFKACYWKANVPAGVGDGSNPTGLITPVMWNEAVMKAMNGVLPADAEYEYSFVEGGSVPFVHVLRNKQ